MAKTIIDPNLKLINRGNNSVKYNTSKDGTIMIEVAGNMVPATKENLKKVNLSNLDLKSVIDTDTKFRRSVDLRNKPDAVISKPNPLEYESPEDAFQAGVEEAQRADYTSMEKEARVKAMQTGKILAADKRRNGISVQPIDPEERFEYENALNFLDEGWTKLEPDRPAIPRTELPKVEQPNVGSQQKLDEAVAGRAEKGLIRKTIDKISDHKVMSLIVASGAVGIPAMIINAFKDDKPVPGTPEQPSTTTVTPKEKPLTKEELDDINKSQAQIRSLELLSAGKPVEASEVYKNMEAEYLDKYRMSKEVASDIRMKAIRKKNELASDMYDNMIATFFDRVYQGLGRSTGQTSMELLKTNQKLKGEIGQLMEGSALLAQSMTLPKNDKEAFKLRAIGSRMIMDVTEPGTWDKISENAIRAAAGIQSVLLHNNQISAERAKIMYGQKMKELEGKYGKKVDQWSIKDKFDVMTKLLDLFPKYQKENVNTNELSELFNMVKGDAQNLVQ